MIKQKDLVFILISSTIVTFIWIGSTLYHAYVTSTIEEPLATFIQPISSRFNTQTIDKIMKRRQTVPTYDLSGVRVPTPTISPDESITPSDEAPTPAPQEEPPPLIDEPTPPITEPTLPEEGDGEV